MDYIQKSANILVQTQMQYSPNGLYTMTTYAKLLYQQGKFPEAESIFHRFLDEEHPDLLICKGQCENVMTLNGQKLDLLEENTL